MAKIKYATLISMSIDDYEFTTSQRITNEDYHKAIYCIAYRTMLKELHVQLMYQVKEDILFELHKCIINNDTDS